MNNVGEIKTFLLNGQQPAEPLAYVWKFWDSDVIVTTSGTVSKALNIGGDPSDSYLVRYSATVVDDIGQSTYFPDSLSVNNPPSIIPGSARLSHNGETFSFQTHGTLIAYDLESQPVQFSWYAGGRFLGVGTNNFDYAHATGTYAGTDVGFRLVSSSGIDYTVTANGSLVCLIWDNAGGTTAVDFPLYGRPPQAVPLSSNSSSGVSVDAAGTPSVRIGPNAFAQFVVYTPSQTHPLTFQWAYFGSNGWAHTAYSSGTTTAFSDGSFQNLDIKFVGNESPGPKTAECFVRDSSTGHVSTVKLGILLTANHVPAINSVTILPAVPHVGDVLSFSVNATDADNDLVHYKWVLTSAPNPGQSLYGRTIAVATTGVTVGHRVTATLTVSDNLGATVTTNVQSPALLA